MLDRSIAFWLISVLFRKATITFWFLAYGSGLVGIKVLYGLRKLYNIIY